MDFHKERCKKLKEIRKKVADKIGIDLHQTECTFEGKCSGTCPKCQQEEQRLNQALLAKTALATGVVAMSVGLTGCNYGQTAGDVQMVGPGSSTCTTEDYLEGETQGEPMELEGEETWNPDVTDENDGTQKDSEDEEPEELEGDVVYVPEDNEEDADTSENVGW